ncbi:MAG: hypothetical protein NVS2B7_33990 [Herpetosiphon sp.]
MAGSNKKQFVRRSTSPTVATTNDFEERFARETASRRHSPIDLPAERIDPSPFQTRRTFADIPELAATMRVHGFTSRLWVREHPSAQGRYQLAFGERRLRAAREAGIQVIPCEVTQFNDRELLEIGLTENLQRRDLDPLEEAQGLQKFMSEFGYSYRELAERIGKDKGYIENRLRLLRLPVDVQQMVLERPETMSAAREVARLPTPETRAPLITGVVENNLSLKATHMIVDEALAEPRLAPGMVAARVAARRGMVADQSTASASLSARIDRDLEKEWSDMTAKVRHWESRLMELTPAQRSHLQARMNELLMALEGLAEHLQ